jgi:hypothetical protein
MVLSSHASYPHERSYVLKLHIDASPRQRRIVGRLEHVASGRQFQFTSGDELLACLIDAAALHELPGSQESGS